MNFAEPWKLSSKALWVYSPMTSSRANSRTRSNLQLRSRASIGRIGSLEVPTSSASSSSARQKRTRDEGSATKGGTERSKSNNTQAIITDPDPKEHRHVASDLRSIQETEDDSLVRRETEEYGNRIHILLVTSPARRLLYLFTSARELLEVIRDAITAHRSLLEDGKMLYRDISESNIIIATLTAKGDSKGRLIDMDLGKELNSVPIGASTLSLLVDSPGKIQMQISWAVSEGTQRVYIPVLL